MHFGSPEKKIYLKPKSQRANLHFSFTQPLLKSTRRLEMNALSKPKEYKKKEIKGHIKKRLCFICSDKPKLWTVIKYGSFFHLSELGFALLLQQGLSLITLHSFGLFTQIKLIHVLDIDYSTLFSSWICHIVQTICLAILQFHPPTLPLLEQRWPPMGKVRTKTHCGNWKLKFRGYPDEFQG